MSIRLSNHVDENPRPAKRQRMEGPESENAKAAMAPLPSSVLLLSLQSLLAHPPTHRNHTRSLFLSLFGLRKCLSISGLDSITECRAWTELAETGFRIGLDEPGIESEVEKAITKALLIVHKHPSLRIYKPRLTFLSARLASYQNNPKFAQTTLKKLLTNFLIDSDPPHLTYFAHLSYISSLESNDSSSRAITAIRDLYATATRKRHHDVALLATVLELRELMQNGLWTRVGEALSSTEKELGIEVASTTTPTTGTTNLQKVLIVHVLMIGILFHTYVGDGSHTQTRMKKLHDLLDGGVLDAFGPSGVVDVHFPGSETPLEVQVTHPRVLFTIGFLVSSVAKRNPVGRKPKRKLYAAEGTLIVEREIRKEVTFPSWASTEDVAEFQLRMHKMKADMMCELIGVAVSRSEFDDAEREIAKLVAHTRTHGLFSSFCARITLHQAHLAHALCQTERALKYYQVSAFLSRKRAAPLHISRTTKPSPSGVEEDQDEGLEDYWLNVSARAGELWLRVGIASQLEDEEERGTEMDELRKDGMVLVKECDGLGGTLKAVGEVLTACLSKEFLVAKTHLRNALNLSTAALDNHLRALVLALVAAQYVHTSTEHAETMLDTAEQLAAGLGAQPKPVVQKSSDDSKTQKAVKALPPASRGSEDGVGNAHLRLWIGERTLELKRRAGDDAAVAEQVKINEKLEHAVVKVRKRKFA